MWLTIAGGPMISALLIGALLIGALLIDALLIGLGGGSPCGLSA